MGDMADFANDDRMDEVIRLHEHRSEGFPCDEDAFEDGLIDSIGGDTFADDGYHLPRSGPSGCFVPVRLSSKPSGPGPCPKCGKPTRDVIGQFGDFWGCTDFPDCKGSRNGE